MIAINCAACQKSFSIDETKLPMKEVLVACPSCSGRIPIDRRSLAAQQTAAAEVTPPTQERAIVIGVDDAALREALQLIHFEACHFASAEEARAALEQEGGSLIIIRPEHLTPPPLASMLPILSISPSERRRVFLVLVADNLKTFDGNAAFLYEVNLVVATRDLPALKKIHADAMNFHRRLYRSFQLPA